MEQAEARTALWPCNKMSSALCIMYWYNSVAVAERRDCESIEFASLFVDLLNLLTYMSLRSLFTLENQSFSSRQQGEELYITTWWGVNHSHHGGTTSFIFEFQHQLAGLEKLFILAQMEREYPFRKNFILTTIGRVHCTYSVKDHVKDNSSGNGVS